MSYTSNFHDETVFYDLPYTTVKFQTDVRHRFVALAKKKYMKWYRFLRFFKSKSRNSCKIQNAILVWCHYKISNLFSAIIVWQEKNPVKLKGYLLQNYNEIWKCKQSLTIFFQESKIRMKLEIWDFKKVVKLERYLHCLAILSTNFHDFYRLFCFWDVCLMKRNAYFDIW